MNTLADWAVTLSFPPALLFVIYYAAFSPWRSTVVGRSLMYQSIGMVVVTGVVIASIWLGEYEGRGVVRFIGYSILTITLWRMFFTLRHYQKMPLPFDRSREKIED